MKNLLFSLAFLSTICSTAYAQVEFGLKAGPMLSRTYISSNNDMIGTGFVDAKLSFLAGGFIRLPIGSQLGLQAELLYSRKGDESRDFGYVSIPLMLQYEFFPKLRAEAGVEVGYLLSIDDGLDRGIFESHPFYGRMDVGLNAGLSYDVLEKLNIGLRYILGVYDIYRPEFTTGFGSTTIDDSDLKNHTLQLSLGYRLK